MLDNFRAWTDRSRRNLGVDTLDLVQLHCPPTPVYSHDEVYDALDTLVEEGAIAAYGVSVETVEEALDRHRPARRRDRPDHRQRLPAQAARRGVPGRAEAGVGHHRPGAARLRAAVRQVHQGHDLRGQRPPELQPRRPAFDVGETFSGVDFGQGLKAVAEFEELVPDGVSTAQAAIAWIAAQDGSAP